MGIKWFRTALFVAGGLGLGIGLLWLAKMAYVVWILSSRTGI